METLLLGISFASTLVAKALIVWQHDPANPLVALCSVTLPDAGFFAMTAGLITFLYVARPARTAARCGLFVAAIVLAWSIANAGCLLGAGVQLQRGVFLFLMKHPAVFWPLVQSHLLKHMLLASVAGAGALAFSGWIAWRLAQPKPLVAERWHHARHSAATAAIASLAIAATWVCPPVENLGFAGDVLGFSSHWHALRLGRKNGQLPQAPPKARVIPRVGARQVGLPTARRDELPNVVLVLLESVSHQATSLNEAGAGTTPTLARLAAEGVEFTTTRIPVSHTTKALWSTLTGVTPDLEADFAEAVPVTKPYESLATLLARVGYRSAFFEMSMGMFECGPGLFANLGFEQAWFRENLADPSVHLGHFGGDDFRVIEPAFEWVGQGSRPFLLTMITTVAHKPYEVPAWYGQAKTDPFENYVQAVRYTDAFLEELLRTLDERGLAENTILCVLGDHGESFRPACSRGRWVPYEEIVRVPWVIRWPSHVPAGQRIDWPCSQMDVTPTLLKLIGFDITEGDFDGKDAFTPSDPNRRLRFASWFAGSAMGILEGNRKWIYWPGSETVYEYNLTLDPGEQARELLTDEPRDRIVAELVDWREQSQIRIPATHFHESLLFNHWRTFASGRSAWSRYVP